MPSSYTTNLVSTDRRLRETIIPVPVNKPLRTVVVCCNLDTNQHYELAHNFKLSRLSTDTVLTSFDAALIDCRGTTIRYPSAIKEATPKITLALVDENSVLPDPYLGSYSGQDTLSNSANSIAGLELITEAELNSPILKLKLDARIAQVALAYESQPAQIIQTPLLESETQHKRSHQPDLCPASPDLQENAFDVLQILLQSSTDWMVLKDLEHRFIAVSNRFAKSQGKPIDQIIGKNDLEIGTLPELVLGNPDKNWVGYWHVDDEIIASGEPSFTEHLVIQENSLQQVREYVAKIPLKNKHGKVYGLLVCVTELHRTKLNNDNVSELASRHNIQVSPIIRALDNERRKAEAMTRETRTAFNQKNNFIATASHDLRQPLHAIGLFIESLESQIVDSSQRSTLAKMKQSSKDLNALLNSILDISKLDAEAVKVSKSHFCVAPILKSIEDEFGTEASQKSLNLNVNTSSSVVYTDSLLLIRIIRNLVSNAVKHTLSGNINVITEVDNSSLLIHVKDTGPGIPKEQYQAIFDEYLQLGVQSSEPNYGMGLGLSIVKRLTDLLELPISLDSKLDNGTCFTLNIPLGDASNSRADDTIENKQQQSLDTYKVMVVEDNPIVLDAMQEMLRAMNCDAYPASNIAEGLEIIKELEELPDLLLVDYQLENGVTGDTAIKEICEAANANLPAIIVTGNTHSELFRQASKFAYRVLNKPVNPDVLLNSIASAIKEHRDNASAEQY